MQDRIIVEKFGPLIGSKYYAIRSDNACLFNALSMAVYGNQDSSKTIRKKIVEHVVSNWLWYEELTINEGDENPFRTCEQYASYMLQPNVWGTSCEARAAHEVFSRTVMIIENGNAVAAFHHPSLAEPIYLRRQGNHFDLYCEKPKNLIIHEEGPINPRGIIRHSETHTKQLHFDDVSFGIRNDPCTSHSSEQENRGETQVIPTGNQMCLQTQISLRNSVFVDESRDKNIPSVSSCSKRKIQYNDNSEGVSKIARKNRAQDSNILKQSADCYAMQPFVNLGVRVDAVDEVSNGSRIDNLEKASTRPNVWKKLPCIQSFKPRLELKKRESQYFMNAKIYGSEEIDTIEYNNIGDPTYECMYCKALHWKVELSEKTHSTASCCHNGARSLPETGIFKQVPKNIAALYENENDQSKHFLKNILAYNRIFTTVVANCELKQVGNTPFAMKVNGEVKFRAHSFDEPVYRISNNKFQAIPSSRTSGQIYFMDMTRENAEQRRVNSTLGDELDDDLIVEIEEFLRENNNFIRCFQTAKDIWASEKKKAEDLGREPKEVVLVINPKDVGENRQKISTQQYLRRLLQKNYEVYPCTDYLAAVFVGTFPEYTYDVKYFPREFVPTDSRPYPPSTSLQTLDTQMFPLIYLFGETCHIETTEREDLPGSFRQYFNYRLFRRENEKGVLVKTKKLYLFWLINAYIRVYDQRLSWIEKNQKTLRIEEYSGLHDYIAHLAEEQNKQIGRVIIVPPSFEGTPQFKRELFLDATTLVQRYGLPSFFITVTANRNSPEVIEECKRSKSDPRFRPDVNNRVFFQQLLNILHDIVYNQIFGRVKAYFLVFEFQNRGNIHCHIIIILWEEDKPRSASDVNKFVWAFIPDKQKYPNLHKLVSDLMFHGPCDNLPPEADTPFCVKNNVCRYKYPMEFTDNTSIKGRRTIYRRPNDGINVLKQTRYGTRLLDNRNVVPYNPVLLLRYRCHINVDYCTSATAIRYLAKYLVKPEESISVAMSCRNNEKGPNATFEWDEPKLLREMRSIGPNEAHFRLSGHSLHMISQPVESLPVHLKDRQNITFFPGQEQQALEANKKTKLTAWFKLNRETNGQDLYVNVVNNHKFDNKKGEWIKTKSPRHTLGRIGIVHLTPTTTEKFYLRTLLANVPGLRSFENAMTVDGEVKQTFQDACEARGLYADDNTVISVFAEMSLKLMPAPLRLNFAFLLAFNRPSRPDEVWLRFADAMSQDFEMDPGLRTQRYILALHHIQSILEVYDLDISEFNLTIPNVDEIEDAWSSERLDAIVSNNHNTNVDQTVTEMLRKNPTTEQMTIINKIIAASLDTSTSTEKLFFLSGVGGSGKTFLYNYLISLLEKERKVYTATAYTGIASVLIINGVTSHKAFGIPIYESPLGSTTSMIKLQSKKAHKLRQSAVIIWDEVSMVCKWQLEIVDRLLRDVTSNHCTPFGGKVMVLGGDMRQMLPVVKKASAADIIDMSIISSHLWSKFEKQFLTKNIRAEHDEKFADFIMKISDGSANKQNSYEFDIPADLLVTSQDDLIKFCFGSDLNNIATKNCAILSPTNVAADEINNIVLNRMTTEGRTYYSFNKLIEDKSSNRELQSHFTQEFLNSLSSGGIPNHQLFLRIGTPVLLSRNIHVGLGLCNGTRMEVVALHKSYVECKVLIGIHKGNIVAIPKIKFITSEFNIGFDLMRFQLPLKVAFCMTINKSQGQTLEKEGLYLPTPPFTHGQLYVAFSRVKRRCDIKVLVENTELQGQRQRGVGGSSQKRNQRYTQNPVYQDVINEIV